MTELKFHVDESKCIRCGACIRDCAPAILEFDPDSEYPRVIPGAEPGCTRCQHCLAVCPRAAVEIFGRDPEESLPGNAVPDPDEILSLIANRRSFRSYRHENLDRVTLDKLKDMKKKTEITEDDLKDAEKRMQDLTDKFCKEIDVDAAKKEKEILEL